MKIGILGGGQLARMMALEGVKLGQEFVFLDPAEDACARALGEHICAPFDDEEALTRLADQCDVVTLDFENVPVTATDFLAERVPMRPGSAALRVAQDRMAEKTFFSDRGIDCPLFAPADTEEELRAACEEIGLPCVIKTRRMGYDGKGQAVLEDLSQASEIFQVLGGGDLIVEAKVPFKRELSIIACRSASGATVFYPLAENRHKNGILVTTFAPAVADHLLDQAKRYATRILDALDYCGVLAVELFDLDGRLLVNEIAPRVHNSGHWTLDGAVTSQFENHLRAIMDWPLGSTNAIGATAMMNWIGAMPDPSNALSYPNAHWHDYGKKPRPGRKVGHVNICAPDIVALQAELGRFAMALGEQLKSSGADAFIRS
ncbi:MAG: 5-(carboxyamino)imidazole ribonucleotide synthase [Pseudomonadota bacterium]